MNALLTIAAICLVFLIFLLAPLPKGPGYPFPSAPELVISFLAIPVILTAFGIFVVSLYQVMRKGRNSKWLACLLITLPYAVFLSVSLVKGTMTANNRGKFVSWPRLGMYLRDQLVEFHKIHPECFTYIGSDEEIRVSGFGEFLEKKASRPEPDIWGAVKIRSGKVIDPWGNPVRYGMDRDHDGYIEVEGRKYCTDHVSPPSLDYQAAVMVRLGQSPDRSGGVGQHVGRH
jgi:hypothetical protein